MVDSSVAASKACESSSPLQPCHVRHSLSHWVLSGEETLYHLFTGVHSRNDPDLLFWVRVLPLLGFLLPGDWLPMRGQAHPVAVV